MSPKTIYKNRLKYVIFAILFTLSPQLLAAVITTTFNVTATVQNTCLVSAFNATTMAFGNYTGAQINQPNTISFQCTAGDSLVFALNSGNTGTFTNRVMVNGSNNLNYNIYTSSALTTVWGDGTGSTATVASTATGAVQNLTAYGSVSANQMSVPAGNYLDSITVTLIY